MNMVYFALFQLPIYTLHVLAQFHINTNLVISPEHQATLFETTFSAWKPGRVGLHNVPGIIVPSFSITELIIAAASFVHSVIGISLRICLGHCRIIAFKSCW